MMSLDIPEGADSPEITQKLSSFKISDGDRIRLFPIVPYNQNAVYVEGHVVRPGKYSYRPDMRVTDVISSYKDLLPEPAAQYAEIIRLNAPDFRSDEASAFALMTLHRPSNVDSPATLQALLQSVEEIADCIPVVFPVHPRTQLRIEALSLHYSRKVDRGGVFCESETYIGQRQNFVIPRH